MNLRHWKLRNKVIFHVVVLGLAAAVVLTVLYVTTQRRIIATLADQKAGLVASLVMDSVFTLKKCGRVEDAQAKILELVQASGSLRGIRILTTDGRVFVSTNVAENGAVLPPQEFLATQEMLDGHTPRRLSRIRADGSIEALMLVENRPDCHACHSAERTYNGLLDVHIDTSDSAAVLRTSQWKGVTVAAVTLAVLAFVILRLFERLINRPILRLRQGMAKVTQGDLTARLGATKKDELGRLAESFDSMVANLRTANRKIEDLYNERIERSEHLAAFGELAAGLAHEVRNPLAGIKGALEIISRGTPTDDPRREIFDEILRQADKVFSVIQDFLSYARLRPFQIGPASPNLIAENAIRMAKTQAQEKEIDFVFRGLPDEARFRLDADRIQDVLLNLLLNAVAAVESQGTVAVEARLAPDGGLEIEVADDGSGIKEAFLPLIFTPFFSTKKGGTGLGLSICRKIVEAHGGTISVASQEGRGTAFTIRIPAAIRGG
jgi:hypothetical protein